MKRTSQMINFLDDECGRSGDASNSFKSHGSMYEPVTRLVKLSLEMKSSFWNSTSMECIRTSTNRCSRTQLKHRLTLGSLEVAGKVNNCICKLEKLLSSMCSTFNTKSSVAIRGWQPLPNLLPVPPRRTYQVNQNATALLEN